MDELNPKDLLASFSLLNYLFAGYQGSLGALRVLHQVRHPAADEPRAGRVEHLLSKIQRWSGDLMDGNPLIITTWQRPETFEATEAFDALARLKDELRTVAKELEEIFRIGSLFTGDEDTKFVLAQRVRYASARALFLRGCVDFGQAVGFPEMVQANLTPLPIAEQEINTAYGLVEAYLKPEQRPETFFDDLFLLTQDLPAIFRSQFHDLSILLATFEFEFTYDLAGIQAPEANRWYGAGIDPKEAGYWRAHLIGPEEADAWRRGGIADPVQAYRWRLSGFNPGEALRWAEKDIPAALARRWQDEGYSPAQAQQYITRDIKDPSGVKQRRRER